MMIRWLFLFIMVPFVLSANPSKVEFFEGNLSSAKSKAAIEGKLYFAEFSASWCAPCRLLEETTFSDPTVIDYISKNYIPVKVDIDDFDGIALKQVYNVQTIPTIIIFNSKGKLLEKYDQALPTSKMLTLLKKHNIPSNRVKTVSATTPPPRTNQVNTNTYNTTPSTKLVSTSHSPMKQQGSRIPSKSDKKPITPIKTEESIPANSGTDLMPQGNGLYRFKVRHQPSKGFSVQIGAYREYGNVLRAVASVQDRFKQPIIVHIMQYGDQTIYKILVGEFNSRQQAIDYQSNMKQKGVDGVLKDLSTMK